MTVTVRPATPDDFDQVSALLVRAYLPCGYPSSHPYFSRLRESADRAEHAELLVADDAGRVVGTVTYCPLGSPYREIAGEGEGEFRMLAVDPGEQSRGIGRKLVKHCLERARAEGMNAVVLSTAPWMTTAHHIYEKMGFERSPERDWSPQGGVSLKTYVLKLGDA